MENNNLCQSCSMPLDNLGAHGTEKNGAPSREYCKYCYQNGAFINPKMTIDEMRTVVKTQMEHMKIRPDIIEQAVNVLPSLNRWKK